MQYRAQANEDAIRQQLQAIAVFGTFDLADRSQIRAAQVSALSLRVDAGPDEQPGQQRIEDIQTDLAIAQNTMKDAGTRRPGQGAAPVHHRPGGMASPDQVASELLSLQNALQASYQVTSKLAQLSLVKFL